MSLTYAQYVSTLANLLVVNSAETNFVQILPSVIDYAEQRIYRETDLLTTRVRDTSTNLTANTRNFTLPTASGRFFVVDDFAYILNGVRTPLRPISLQVLNVLWPSDTAPSTTSKPVHFAMLTDQTLLVGPAPGTLAGTLNAEVTGTIRPTPLSASNTTTYLTTYYPDLFLAASMVFAMAYQRDFGAQADDPKSSSSWEAQYQTLLQSTNIEEARKRFASQGWTSARPETLVQR